ncbi:MAG: cryptochrome/photolyase family protein, partial [Erythrobacter sp.]|nr:cryptochrome/photolyase family protein [Erythrobacter sp.]
MSGPVLVPILGDQLTRNLASIRGRTKDDTVILMMEVWDEATYVKHHKQKIALIFSAMRHFAEELRDAGWTVDYVKLDSEGNSGSFTGEVARAIEEHSPRLVSVVEAGEWRVREAMDQWADKFACEVEILGDDRFISTQAEFDEWAEDRKDLRMEFFYREMRRKTGLLMAREGDTDKPEGGDWNYDSENRKPPKEGLSAPERPKFEPDEITQDVIELVEDRFGDHFGSLERFGWPVTRDEAEEAADAFFAERIECFGPYQDAMVAGEDDLFHSMLSTSINLGLLDPLELCQRAEKAYKDGKAPINSVEGFIRQIIGWREYVRGIYFREGPEYTRRNALNHQRKLPEFYWGAETGMACVSQAVAQTREEAYAHHIQRLMVTGNFALLAGINPHEVHEWYLAVYADAYEWVEAPNTIGMSQFADGGIIASKPYVSSGAYINRMSDYCQNCSYSVSAKTGEKACPFNLLY